MSDHLDQIIEKTHELARIIAHLTTATIERDFTVMALDLSKLNANTAEIQRIAAAAANGESATIAAAVAAAQESDQAALDAATSAQAADIAPLTAEFPPSASTTGNLSISPASVSFSAGVSGSASVTISGGVSPYTASGELPGVTFNGSAFVADTTTIASAGTVTISDSSSPALTGGISIVIS